MGASTSIASNAYKDYSNDKKGSTTSDKKGNTTPFQKKYINSNDDFKKKYGLNATVPSFASEEKDRGVIDRIFGVLGYGGVTEGLYNLTDDDNSTTFTGGLKQGLNEMNPFEDDVSNRHTFSDVLQNAGWEDENPDKLSLSDVGRGVTGFVGDVLLDPLTYVNPFSSAAKIAKGSGATLELATALTRNGQVKSISEGIEALKTGAIDNNKLSQVANFSIKDAREIISKQYTPDGLKEIPESVIDQKAEELVDSFASKVLKYKKAQNEEGLTIGLNNLPFSNKMKIGGKSLDTFKKTLVSADKLRGFGDKTGTAGLYNSVAKSLRTSNIGKKFSNMNALESIAKTNPALAMGIHHLNNLSKATKTITADNEDIGVAEKFADYFSNLTKDQEIDFIRDIENRSFDDYFTFLEKRAKVIDAVNKAAKDETGGVVKSAVKEVEEIRNEFNNQYRLYTNKYVNDYDSQIRLLFNKNFDDMSDVERVTSMRLVSMFNNKSGYKDLLNSYAKEYSQPKVRNTYGKVIDMATIYKNMDEDAAKSVFMKLSPKEKEKTINSLYSNQFTLSTYTPSKLDDSINTYKYRIKEVEKASANNQRKVYENLDKFMHSGYLKSVAESMESTEDYMHYLNEFGTKWDEDGKKLAKIFNDSMERCAREEVKRGLLDANKAEAMKGRYVQHVLLQRQQDIKNLMHEKNNGAFNPELFGILNGHNKSRKAATLDDLRKLQYLVEDSMSELYLGRCISSNKICYDTDVQNFVINNFAKPMKEGDEIEKGYIPIVRFADLQARLKFIASERMKGGFDSLISDEEFARMAKEANIHPDDMNNYRYDLEFEAHYQEFVKEFFDGDEKRIKTFTPNIPYQEVDPNSIFYASGLKNVNVYQMNESVLERTNVLSKTQKYEMSNSLMNLYDRFLTIFKAANTVVAPAFHIQNSASNAFQSFLGIGEGAFDVKNLKRAHTILNNPDSLQKVTLGGKEYSYKQLHYMAKRGGIIDEMFHKYEWSIGNNSGLLSGEGKNFPPSLDPTNIDDFFLYKVGTKVGAQIEGTQRLNMFMKAFDMIDAKEVPNEAERIGMAVEKVNEFLFDYGELTDFEKYTMKRIVPFYTFMRKNIPMELQQMIERPQLFSNINKAMTNTEKTLAGDDYKGENDRNTWRQEYIQLGHKYGIADQLPYNQLERVSKPSYILGQTTPLIKTPIEAATGKYVYTGVDIDSPIDYLLSQSTPTKLYNLSEKKALKDERDAKIYSASSFFASPIQPIQ